MWRTAGGHQRSAKGRNGLDCTHPDAHPCAFATDTRKEGERISVRGMHTCLAMRLNSRALQPAAASRIACWVHGGWSDAVAHVLQAPWLLRELLPCRGFQTLLRQHSWQDLHLPAVCKHAGHVRDALHLARHPRAAAALGPIIVGLGGHVQHGGGAHDEARAPVRHRQRHIDVCHRHALLQGRLHGRLRDGVAPREVEGRPPHALRQLLRVALAREQHLAARVLERRVPPRLSGVNKLHEEAEGTLPLGREADVVLADDGEGHALLQRCLEDC
mmetsp:Transcript_101049/g.326157  ORF Transcript_101049/g.326157 Transcript_101049/m.326157 type:complete len:273 (-) Transcript_101049:235-1053(-)